MIGITEGNEAQAAFSLGLFFPHSFLPCPSFLFAGFPNFSVFYFEEKVFALLVLTLSLHNTDQQTHLEILAPIILILYYIILLCHLAHC